MERDEKPADDLSRDKWPFAPVRPEADRASLPGGTAAEARKKDDDEPMPPGKEVNLRPQLP